MDIFLAVLLFAVGAFIVAKGADFFVDASSWMSDVTGISKVLIGATLVAIATSGPELFVSLFASLEGKSDMSTGNVIGSHLCNLGIGFALIATFRPSKNSDRLYVPNSLFTLLTAVLMLTFYFIGEITPLYGVILLLVYSAFTFVNIRFAGNGLDRDLKAPLIDSKAEGDSALSEKPKRIKKPTNKKEIIINLAKFILGLVGIILGSRLIVDNATVLAKAMGASELLIGLTIVAIGTSLPEIVTTIAALIKKESDLGIGNIFGSCVFNNAFIIPISAFVLGSLTFGGSLIVDLSVAIGMTLVSIIPTMIGKRIYRFQGIAIFLMYVSYVTYLVIA